MYNLKDFSVHCFRVWYHGRCVFLKPCVKVNSWAASANIYIYYCSWLSSSFDFRYDFRYVFEISSRTATVTTISHSPHIHQKDLSKYILYIYICMKSHDLKVWLLLCFSCMVCLCAPMPDASLCVTYNLCKTVRLVYCQPSNCRHIYFLGEPIQMTWKEKHGIRFVSIIRKVNGNFAPFRSHRCDDAN